jgi:glycosyltransferase involved in cell wall biosynthesis
MVLTALIALRQVTDDFEIIVVNDGSRDYTKQVLEEMVLRYPELHIINHPVNCGYGAVLRTGFSAATKEWVFYTDGDAQYNPLELPRLVDALSDSVDVVNGYKISRSDSIFRTIAGRLYHYFVRIAFGFRLRDVDCDFRLIRRKIFDLVPLESDSGTICVEMVKKFQDAGFVFAEVPVHHYPRPYGSSQFFSPHHILRTVQKLFPLWWKLVVRREHLQNIREHTS